MGEGVNLELRQLQDGGGWAGHCPMPKAARKPQEGIKVVTEASKVCVPVGGGRSVEC